MEDEAQEDPGRAPPGRAERVRRDVVEGGARGLVEVVRSARHGAHLGAAVACGAAGFSWSDFRGSAPESPVVFVAGFFSAEST